MTVIASICEQWAMPLEPPQGKWFLDWVLRSPKEVSGHLTAGWMAYSVVKALYPDSRFLSAREYFGGMGAQSLMIRSLWPTLVDHTVMDYEPDAVDHLKRVLPAEVRVRQGDAYDRGTTFPADVVGLDIGDGTVWKTRQGEPYRLLLDRVFALKPKAVVLTDIAGPRLHLQRERYESLLGRGTCGSYGSYLEAFATRLEVLYGYTLAVGYSHRWSTVMAFVPADLELMVRGTIHPVPSSPVGLELL